MAANTVLGEGAPQSAARYLRRALAEQPKRAVRGALLRCLIGGRAEAVAGPADQIA
jgi:hypothetical protein